MINYDLPGLAGFHRGLEAHGDHCRPGCRDAVEVHWAKPRLATINKRQVKTTVRTVTYQILDRMAIRFVSSGQLGWSALNG